MATVKNAKEIQKAAKEFALYWKDKGYEKGESQRFWMELLGQVFGVENPSHFIEFEDQVHIDKATGFIDAYLPETKVLIEQKSINKDLRKPIKQSDGSLLTPFQQAKKYIAELPVSRHPKWVITCNFKEFLVYDMESPHAEPESILLENLPKEYYRLSFLVSSGNENIRREEEISIKAGEIVGKLYDALSKQYRNISDSHSQRSLNVLCVRLVFCFYAEDANVFGKHLMFHDYMRQFDAKHFRSALIELFKVLDTKTEERDPYLDDDLAAFPYVNGGLFAEEDIEIPQFTDEIRTLILQNASEEFDWSEISPTIFGAVFESTLNPETRRSGGMHYTSIENIHKVIDPLFLDALKAEFAEIAEIKTIKLRDEKLEAFTSKLASLCFLDPAAGSGNFLTETYISLRRLENEALKLIKGEQITLASFENPIKVKINQFYGIEINDFAVTVAKTALWIAESQMLRETENIINMNISFLPLTTNATIVEGNSLRIDWNDVVPKSKLNYIMGNPPFVGGKMMSPHQKEDMLLIFGKKWKNLGNMDYVCCWYKKAADYIKETPIECALVSTNSITQGQAVACLLGILLNDGLIINFAWRTFRWDSEATLKAHVHCVIIGFSYFERNHKVIYSDTPKKAKYINGFLIDAENIIIDNRTKPISDVPAMDYGNMPNDGGNFILSAEEKQKILQKEPNLENYIRPFVGSVEFINRKTRYCFWLKGVNPSVIKNSRTLYERVENVKRLRLASSAAPTREKANTPHLFFYAPHPENTYLLVPRVSSERRRYIPMGFMDKNTIASDAVLIVPDATLYHFGVLQSNVHMAWVRYVCGRLKSDYRYSNKVVYNNFPWPNPTDAQKARIEQTAQGILDARAKYPDCSLADLYDELTMPPELRKAHQDNDRAVMAAYGFPVKNFTESDCVAELMKLYQKLTAAE